MTALGAVVGGLALLFAASMILGLGEGAKRPDYVLRVALPDKNAIGLPQIAGDEGAEFKPLIVLDAGHGGFDPGASGPGIVEKDITLALAMAVRDELLATGVVRVALTREDDRFLALDERSAIARNLGADLFLSLHADLAGDAEEVVGASVYTLSTRASDRASQRFAARENAANAVNGVPITEASDNVRSILVDLSRRRSQAQAARFGVLIESEGEASLTFRDPAQRSAALIVLQAPDVPSVLFEVGYISNAGEAASMASAQGRAVFARVLANAARRYFAEATRDASQE